VLVKEMGLDLMRWDQGGQDDTSFLTAITLTEDMLDATEGVPDQFCRILGGYREGNGHTIGVLRFIRKTIRHEKDCQGTSRHIVSP
jgi:hypothetical protein